MARPGIGATSSRSGTAARVHRTLRPGYLVWPAWLRSRDKAHGRAESAMLAVLASGSLVGLYTVLVTGAPVFGAHMWVVLPVLMAIFIWAAVSRNPDWGRVFLGGAALGFIGRISYWVYLYHLPFLLLLNKYSRSSLDGLTFPVYFIAVVVVGWVSFRWVERRFMRGELQQHIAPSPP